MNKILFICFLFIIIISFMLWNMNTYTSISSYLPYNSEKVKNIRITDGTNGNYIDISSNDEINKFMTQISKIEVKKKFTSDKYVGWLYNFTITDSNENSMELNLEEFININHNYYIGSPNTAKEYDCLVKMCDTAFGK